MKNVKTILFVVMYLFGCKPVSRVESVSNVPIVREKVTELPTYDNFQIYILAGQSNAAGRGIVEAEDTIPHKNVLTIDKENNWIYAKEPLHFYEPKMAGVDCGLSFGKTLSNLYNNKVTIGIIPCAVGGSSIEQWLGDSIHRGVKLYSNLLEKINFAAKYGTIKGVLWHQGENNATQQHYVDYKNKLSSFFTKLRQDIKRPSLPVYAGQLASFLDRNKNYTFHHSLNNDLKTLSSTFENFYIVETKDLKDKGDSLHFDAKSQRMLGKRFAEMVYATVANSKK